MKILHKIGRKIFPCPDIHYKVTTINDLCGDSYWYEYPNYWEPPVLIVLKDICRPGTTVFDVGGNVGGLTSALSRLVGPAGFVCTFEASPRIIGILQKNIIHQGHGNVVIYNKAVFSKTGEELVLYKGTHLNDSLYPVTKQNDDGLRVTSLALDDFCEQGNIYPDVVKMDIEGAEYDALLGARKMLDKVKPHLILEQNSGDSRCFDLLLSMGYLAIDCNTYATLASIAEFSVGAPLKNILFVHKDRLSEVPYRLPMQKTFIRELRKEVFAPNVHAGVVSEKFPLHAGRYYFDMRFSARGENNSLFTGVRLNGKTIFRYHAYSALLATNYTDWMLDIPFDGECEIYFDFLDNTQDATLDVTGCNVYRFDNIKASLWSTIVMQ